MSFLNSLIKDPKYQTRDPRRPEEIDDPEIIISPDTQREQRIPPGQSRTKKWPVLDAHGAPPIDLANWRFEVDGLVERNPSFSLDEFMQLPAVKVYADFHCVTRWSRLDNVWTGVAAREIAKLAGVKPEAKFVLALAYDYGWTTNVPIEYFLNSRQSGSRACAFSSATKPVSGKKAAITCAAIRGRAVMASDSGGRDSVSAFI